MASSSKVAESSGKRARVIRRRDTVNELTGLKGETIYELTSEEYSATDSDLTSEEYSTTESIEL